MPTINKELQSLSRSDVDRISLEFLMGWCDLIGKGYSFRLKGFNHMRERYGLEPLTKEMSFDYRVQYIQENYTPDEIRDTIYEYLSDARVGDTRWTGIELFGCRFGREYARAFKMLLGSAEYRKMSEYLRNKKSMATQIQLNGGIGLAGKGALEKAEKTNLERHGGTNVMHDAVVRQKLANTNYSVYGGPSPFCDVHVRQKGVCRKNPELFASMAEYKKTGVVTDVACESMVEFVAFKKLVDRFGASDVFCQYGLHPYDARYPYNCDFYVKSLDLFIELHFHYTHGGHWFDASNHSDSLRLQHLKESGSAKANNIVHIWSGVDCEKRKKAAESCIKYLVLWGRNGYIEGSDFDIWYYDYDCNFEAFVTDFPGNTY